MTYLQSRETDVENKCIDPKRAGWIGRLGSTYKHCSVYQSILKEINPEYSLEGLMLKLKLQYLGHLCEEPTHWKRPWCWQRLKAGGEEVGRGWHGWIASPTQWTWIWTNSRRQWRTGKPGVLQSMELQRVRHSLVTEQQVFYFFFLF